MHDKIMIIGWLDCMATLSIWYFWWFSFSHINNKHDAWCHAHIHKQIYLRFAIKLCMTWTFVQIISGTKTNTCHNSFAVGLLSFDVSLLTFSKILPICLQQSPYSVQIAKAPEPTLTRQQYIQAQRDKANCLYLRNVSMKTRCKRLFELLGFW